MNEITNKYILKNPISIYEVKEQQFDTLIEKLKFNINNLYNLKEKAYLNIKSSYVFKNPEKLFEAKTNKYLQVLSKLETLSPLLTIKRGYSITKKNGKIITSCNDLKKDDKVTIELKDGTVDSIVI